MTMPARWRRLTPPWLPDYAIAGLSVAAAVAIDFAFERLSGSNPSVSLFLCAIVFVAWVSGTGPALLATALTILAAFTLRFNDLPQLGLFAVGALFVVSLSATRKRAEERARRAEQELRLIVDTIPVLAVRYRPDGFMDFRNQTWRHYTGLSQDNREGQRWGGALHPDDVAMVEREWRIHVASGEPFELEQRMRRADGEYRWHWCRRVPLRDETGEVINWYGVAFDIDDRKRAENALRQSESELAKARHELQLTIDTVPVLMLRHRADGVIDFVNLVGRSYSGLAATTWTRRTSIITHPDDVSRIEAAWDIALAKGESFETEARLRRSDGEYRWFVTLRVPLRNHDGDVVAWYGAALDIEDRKRAEDALRQSEAALLEARHELQLIIDTIPALVVRHGADGIIDFVNETWRRYTGLSQAAWKGRGTVVVHPDDLARVEQVWLAHLKTGEAFETEQRLRNADGEYRWHFLRRVPLRNDSGDLIAWYGAAHDIEDRKRAESALLDREAQLAEARRELQLTIDSIPVMVSTFEADGTRSFVNKTWQNYTGHIQQDATGKGLNTSIYYHPDDVEQFESAWRAARANGEMLSVDVRTRRADGAYRWYTMRRAPHRDGKGNIVKWYSVGVDVDDQRVAENALRESETRLARAERDLRLTLDSIPILAWRTRADGFAEYLNKRWLDYTGASPDEALGWNWQAIMHPDDRAGLLDTWKRMVESGIPGEAEARMRRFDGSYRWFLFRTEALRDETGAVIGWYGTNTDIEDRKQADVALQRAEAYSAEAQKLSQTGSFAWEVATKDYYWSEQTYQILGFDRRVKPSISLVVQRTHPEDRHIMERELNRSAQSVPHHDFGVRLLLPDGQIKHIHLLAHRITYQSGNEEIVGAVMDMTEARKSQETLQAAQSALAHASRAATLGEISASIAHEVNQPLAAIVANGQACLRFLRRETPDLNDVRGAVEWIVKDGNRAGEVIRRVRGLLKKADAEKLPLDVNDAIQEVAALLQQELTAQQVMLRLELASAMPPTIADRVQLQQVIINLVMNSAEAMQAVTDRPRALVIQSHLDEANQVVVAVTDSGVGIPAETADRLFDAFFSTKPSGLGIGLSICRTIIADHGGRLWAADNGEAPGATFRFALPPHHASAA